MAGHHRKKFPDALGLAKFTQLFFLKQALKEFLPELVKTAREIGDKLA